MLQLTLAAATLAGACTLDGHSVYVGTENYNWLDALWR